MGYARRPSIRRTDAEQAKFDPQASRNSTDSISSIIEGGATNEFVQTYNVQAPVDSQAQVIVEAAGAQEASDKKQLVPMVKEVQVQRGRTRRAAADEAYFREPNMTDGSCRRLECSSRRTGRGTEPSVLPYRASAPPVLAPPSRCGTGCAGRKVGGI
jgi:hypothetical protein